MATVESISRSSFAVERTAIRTLLCFRDFWTLQLERTAEAREGEVQRFPIFPGSEAQARAGGQHVFEGWEYYISPRAQHPRSMKAMTWNSVDKMATFDAFRFIDMISPRPLLFVLGTKAVTKWMETEAF
jgi:uncharacterized protein